MGACPCPLFRKNQKLEQNLINDTSNEESVVGSEPSRSDSNHCISIAGNTHQQKLTVVKRVKSNTVTYCQKPVLGHVVPAYVPLVEKQKRLYTAEIKQKMLRRSASSDQRNPSQLKPQYLNEDIVHFTRIENGSNSQYQQLDTRFLNSSSQNYPYNCIGLIVGLTFNKDKNVYNKTVGTGFLISPNLVLTVAHNVFNQETKLANKQLKFYPKVHGSIEDNEQMMEVLEWRFNQQYKYSQKQELSYDYALLKISGEVIRDKYIMIGQDYPTKQAQACIYGYPIDRNEDHEKDVFFQFGAKGEIVKNSMQKLLYRIDTMPGQSGSPIVIQFVKGLYFAVGIHARYQSNKRLNAGCQLGNSKIQCIRKWTEELAPEAKYNIIDFKEIRELPSFEGETRAVKRMQEIGFYQKQIQMEQRKDEKGDRFRWLLVEIAKKYRKISDYHRCLQCLKKAQTLCTLPDKEVKLNYAMVKNEQGITFNLMQQYKQSIQAYENALKIYEEYSKEKNMAIIYNNIGNCHNKLKEVKEAQGYYRKALQINKKYYSKDSDKFGTLYTNFAIFLMGVRKYQQAQELFKKALLIKQPNPSKKDQSQLAKYYFNLAACRFNLNKIQEGMAGYFKAIDLMVKLELTGNQKFNKYLQAFRLGIKKCLQQQRKKEFLIAISQMVEYVSKYDAEVEPFRSTIQQRIQRL